jgi:AcrR family transcriptional regulator
MATTSNRGPGRPPSEEIRTRRKEEILEAAAKFFAERGYSDANTQDLADLLQVGKGTVYRYFPTKQCLFLAAVDRLMQLLEKKIDVCIQTHHDFLDQMTAVVKTYLRFCAEHPEFAELIVQERAQFKDRKKPTFFAYREASIERRRGLIENLIAEGRVRPIPANRVAEVLGDLLHGTMITNYLSGRNSSPEDQAADILDIVLHGILTDSERNRREANPQ